MASSTSRSDIDEDRFYFGKITSNEADEILMKEGGEEGTFLIRESCSSPGNYVLSFISDGQPIHILIQKYKGDGFSLVVLNEARLFNGLDSLVAYYSQHPVGPSTTTLCHPCPGNPFPADVCLHGSSNLLHRSTSQGNIIVVSELLKAGYKKIDVRNNTGQTALHIAAMKGYQEVAETLLQHEANVEVRDEEGVTPLHLACRYNMPHIVQLLVEVGQADVQVRATKTGSVPLHEAAENDSVDCVKALLALGAPSHPRNALRQTPASIAKRMNHSECYNLLVNHVVRVPIYTLKDYYFENLDRVAAQDLLLRSPDTISGHFLLRHSSRKHCGRVLSLLCQGEVYNYEIVKEGDMFCIDDGPYFTCLETLVDHYVHFADGMPCRLQYPVMAPLSPLADTASSRSPVFGYGNQKQRNSEGGESSDMLLATSYSKTSCRASPHLHMDRLHHSRFPSQDSSYSLSKQERASCDDDNPSSMELWPMLSVPSQEDLKPHCRAQNSHESDIIVTKGHDLIDLNEPRQTIYKEHKSNSTTQQKTPPRSKSSLKLDLQNLSISSSGESSSSPTMDGNRTDEIFGEIDINHLTIGECLGNGEFGSVLRGIWLSPSGDKIDVAVKTLHDDNKVNKKNFLKEAEVMMNLNHLYIVKLVGVCHGPPVAMVQELMAMGSLLDFLLEHEEEISVDFHHKLWAAQIAEGMMYLEQKHFVHCDLAARNILLSSMTLAKISDFGLSRALGVDKDYYTAKEGGKWPLKWYALESIYYGTFTHSSDVWSYGVTLWEMYTFGDQPYGEIPGKDVVALLERNERLPRPEKCPKRVYDLMLRCWSCKPKKRPAFRELAAIFRTQPEYINIKPYFKG